MNIFKRKTAEVRDYTALLLQARMEAAASAALEAATAAEEVVAGLYERAFAQADVQGVALPASLMAIVGRQLATCGECAIDVESMAVASDIDVSGGLSPMAWRYHLHLAAPTGTRSVRRYGMDVWHFRVNATSSEPWRGQSAVKLASQTLAVLRRAEGSLANELQGAVGKIMTVPTGTPEATIAVIKADLKALNGKVSLPESTAGGWGQGAAAAPRDDWKPHRLGPEPHGGVLEARRDAANMVLAAGGVPIELVTGGEGGGAREAWRRFLHSTVQPLGKLVVEELRRKTGRRVGIDFAALMASDLAGRARAFQGMVNGGLDVAKAAALAGLMEQDG